ncbi:MAG: GNAT family N-acetyltransferase [Spirochaetales bacterium]|nr:GNAT family N-acetyltransferase [Spirochaetales bacterium]
MAGEIDAEEIGLIEVTAGNIENEHICCAIGNDRVNRARADEKKEWLRERFPRGHRFLKADLRGKVFIEFSPAEESIYPVEAPGYAVIQCFWVSGRYKGHGLGRKLYDECERICRVEGYRGIAAVVGTTKKPFMADKKILVHLGFSPCDRADPWYELVASKFDDAAPDPRFWESARRGKLEGARGLDFFYSPCCPFNRDFTGLMADIAREMGFPVRIKEIRTREDLSLLPIPGGIFSLYHEGELLSTEVMTEPKFRKLLQGIIERGQGEGAAQV